MGDTLRRDMEENSESMTQNSNNEDGLGDVEDREKENLQPSRVDEIKRNGENIDSIIRHSASGRRIKKRPPNFSDEQHALQTKTVENSRRRNKSQKSETTQKLNLTKAQRRENERKKKQELQKKRRQEKERKRQREGRNNDIRGRHT